MLKENFITGRTWSSTKLLVLKNDTGIAFSNTKSVIFICVRNPLEQRNSNYMNPKVKGPFTDLVNYLQILVCKLLKYNN